MPLTPYHLGPGVFVKALLRGGFSLLVFGWAQILMDLQPLVVLTVGRGQPHGFSHTYVGATLIALLAAVSGKYAAQGILRWLSSAGKAAHVSWPVAFLSAFIGTYSHVALDSLVYSDVVPFWPFSTSNPLLGLISLRNLDHACVVAGLAGIALYYGVNWMASRHNKRIKLAAKR